jgi:hypothetical protein
MVKERDFSWTPAKSVKSELPSRFDSTSPPARSQMVVIQAASQCHESEIYGDNSGDLIVTIIAAVYAVHI